MMAVNWTDITLDPPLTFTPGRRVSKFHPGETIPHEAALGKILNILPESEYLDPSANGEVFKQIRVILASAGIRGIGFCAQCGSKFDARYAGEACACGHREFLPLPSEP